MLDALSTTLTNTITLLAKSFRLSSLFPALCFVVVNYLLFLPRLFAEGTPSWLKDGSFGYPLFLTFLLTALISYTLNYLNFPLIYLAEGYPFRRTWWGQWMITWYKDRKGWLYDQTGKAALFVSEAATGKVRRLTEGTEPVTSVAWETYRNDQNVDDERIVYVLIKDGRELTYSVEKDGAENNPWRH